MAKILEFDDSARRSLVQLLATGKVSYAFVGVRTQDVTPTLARHLGLPVSHVTKVGASAEEHGETVVDLIRERRVDLIVNTPEGRGARADGQEHQRQSHPRRSVRAIAHGQITPSSASVLISPLDMPSSSP